MFVLTVAVPLHVFDRRCKHTFQRQPGLHLVHLVSKTYKRDAAAADRRGHGFATTREKDTTAARCRLRKKPASCGKMDPEIQPQQGTMLPLRSSVLTRLPPVLLMAVD